MCLLSKLKDRIFKIRYQVVLLLFFITFLPIFCMQLLNYSATNKRLQVKDSALLEDNLILTTEILNNTLNDYRQILIHISSDDTCINAVKQMDDLSEDSVQYKRFSETLTTIIRTAILTRPEIRAVGIVSPGGNSYLYAEKRENTAGIIRLFQTRKDDLARQAQSSSAISIHTISSDDPCYDSNFPYFYMTGRIVQYDNLKIVGSLILFIDPTQLNTELNNPTSHTYPYADKLLMNGDGRLICSKNMPAGYFAADIPSYRDIDFHSLTEKNSVRQGNYLLSIRDTEYFDLKLVNIVNYNLLHQDLQKLWFWIIVIIFCILLLSLFCAFLLCKNFVLSLEHMSEKINQVNEHHLDITIDTNCHNEMKIIEKSIHRMLSLIRNLLTENKRQNDHILEITKAAYEAELKSMELQINPHFLFNTIDSINWTAIRENCIDVSEQLNRLSYILRYTVYNMNQVVSVRDEIHWLVQYLDLQKIRFHNSFSYFVSAPENVLELSIHKLLLQPFLENSLIHGFENIDRQGCLQIRFRLLQMKYLLISITDNGQGMPAWQTDALNRFFSQKTDHFQGIGLSNIFYRLRSYYPSHRLIVSSSHGMTVFKLFLPVNEMEGTHV